MPTATMPQTADDELVLDVTLPLDPERAFRLWSDADHLARWWGPKDEGGRPMEATEVRWTPSAGERWRVALVAPDGTSFVQGGRFVTVDPPNALAFTFAWEDENGRLGHETMVQVAFEAVDAGTHVRFRQSGFEDASARDGHANGWRECLDRLLDEARR